MFNCDLHFSYFAGGVTPTVAVSYLIATGERIEEKALAVQKLGDRYREIGDGSLESWFRTRAVFQAGADTLDEIIATQMALEVSAYLKDAISDVYPMDYLGERGDLRGLSLAESFNEKTDMLDPMGSFERIRDFYINYLDTAFGLRDEEISKQRDELLRQPGQLCAEPFIEPVLRYTPFEKNLEELVDDYLGNPLSTFSRAERIAFVELALSGLFDGNAAPPVKSPDSATTHLTSTKSRCLLVGLNQANPALLPQELAQEKRSHSCFRSSHRLHARQFTSPAPEEGYLQRRWWWKNCGEPASSLQHFKDIGEWPNKTHVVCPSIFTTQENPWQGQRRCAP